MSDKSKESSPSGIVKDSPRCNEKGLENCDAELALEPTTTIHEGEQKYNRLGWKKLTICLIVEAIALGSLSIPSAFAVLGMVAGVLLTVGLGLVAIYTSYVVGQVRMRHEHVEHYADAVRLIWGKFGYELTGVMFATFLILISGSHALTGTIAFNRIVDSPGTCALIWGVVSAILLFLLALPPSFAEFAILGYIDFVSILIAILVTIIATGVEAHNAPGGLSGVDWSLWPPEDISFYKAFLSVTNIVFAYSFAVCQYSFMAEMHTPSDYVKSIWALGLMEIFIYTVTGALIYAFVGSEVESPALLSASRLISRVAFGIALPVIFISGSINSTVVGRYILGRAFTNPDIRYVHSKLGWVTWIVLIAAITVFAWAIAEAIPFFNDLLGIISSLFISGFSFYFPALFWFGLIKEGKWYHGWTNISLSIVNGLILIVGVLVLGKCESRTYIGIMLIKYIVCGTYASVADVLAQYSKGIVGGSFSCSSSSYE